MSQTGWCNDNRSHRGRRYKVNIHTAHTHVLVICYLKFRSIFNKSRWTDM